MISAGRAHPPAMIWREAIHRLNGVPMRSQQPPPASRARMEPCGRRRLCGRGCLFQAVLVAGRFASGARTGVGRLHRRKRCRGQAGGGDAQADPGQDEAGQQHQPGGSGGQVGHRGQPGCGRDHGHAQQHPHRHFADQPAGQEGDREGDQRQRQEPQPGLDRGVAEGVLHIQRQIGDRPDDRRRDCERHEPGRGKAAPPEQAQVGHGRGGDAQLVHHEPGKGHGCGREQGHDRRARPAQRVAADQREQHQGKRNEAVRTAGGTSARPGAGWASTRRETPPVRLRPDTDRSHR